MSKRKFSNSENDEIESDTVESNQKYQARLKTRKLKYKNVSEEEKEERNRRNREKYNNLSSEEKEERNRKRREKRKNCPKSTQKKENGRNKKSLPTNGDSPESNKLTKYSALRSTVDTKLPDRGRVFIATHLVPQIFSIRNRPKFGEKQLSPQSTSTHVQPLIIGQRTEKCIHCGAMFYSKNPESKPTEKSFDICCKKGAIKIPQPNCPELLRQLFERKHTTMSENFLQNIQQYNNLLSLAAIGYRKYKAKTPGKYCIELEGGFTYVLLSAPNYASPQYNMVWFVDAEKASQNNELTTDQQKYSDDTLRQLFETLEKHNPLYGKYELISSSLNKHRNLKFVPKSLPDNEPNDQKTSSIVALYGDNDTDNTDRGIVCLLKSKAFPEEDIPTTSTTGTDPKTKPYYSYVKQIIPNYIYLPGDFQNLYYLENNGICDLLSYPLLFPFGDNDWYGDNSETEQTKISHCEFYRYMIAHRTSDDPNTFSPMRCAGKLFEQYLVDSYIKAEANRMKYLQHSKSRLRKDTLENIRKYDSQFEDSQSDTAPNVGSQCSGMPSSFTGSPRYLQERYLDVMTLVAKYGEFDLSITFECNPEWPELIQIFDPTYKHNIDDICDVFKIKAMQLIADIAEKQIFGETVAHVAVIEFPKGGLPQLNLLVTLCENDKPKTREVVDKMISVKLPDKYVEDQLFNKVVAYMRHQTSFVCTNKAARIDDLQVCKGGYLCEFSDDEILDEPSLKYRCSRDANLVTPYNWLLLLKYDAPISVKLCNSKEDVVKCLFDKYHPHRANASIFYGDEEALHLNYRCIGAFEAYWRIMEYKTNHLSHSVQRLDLHCLDKQSVYFKDEEHSEAADKERVTTLLAWFKLNQEHFDESSKYLYIEIPEHYIFVKGIWKKRKNRSNSIGRIYFSRHGSEEYYLRILLLNVRGAKSYDDLKTVDTCIYKTFKDATIAAGYLNDDSSYKLCLVQAITHRPSLPARQIRAVFAYILALESPKDPKILYDNFVEFLQSDFEKVYTDTDTINALVFNDINRITVNLGLAESDLKSMLEYNADQSFHKGDDDKYLDDQLEKGEEMRKKLNVEQKRIAKEILVSVLKSIDPSYLKSLDESALKNLDQSALKNLDQSDTKSLDESVLESLDESDPKSLDESALKNLDQSALKSLDESDPKNLDESDPKSLDEFDPKSLDESDPKSLDEFDPKSLDESDPKSLDESDPKSLDESVLESLDEFDPKSLDQKLFFVDGSAGTGKTFLFETIYKILVGKRLKVHCVSWSGIAAALLPKGRTVHSMFKLPIPLTKDSNTSSIRAQSREAEELRKTDVFIWDELSMTSKYAFKAVDNLLRDVTKCNAPFGGKFLITGGDFRQILPIVSNGSTGDVIKETVKMYPKLWNLFKKYSLKTNLRIGISSDDKVKEFKELLLKIGQNEDFDTKLLKKVSHELQLLIFVYGDSSSIQSKAIITTTNRKSLELNQKVLDCMGGTEYCFVSEDTCESVTGQINHELEHKFLSNIIDKTPSGYPPYELRLKKGAIVMLMRNLDVSSGLTNGTRLIVRDFGGTDENQIDCKILICDIVSEGENRGLRVFIRRIPTINRNENTGLPFYLCRKQFPVRLSFCMTINKSQGQTFDKLGVHLGNGLRSHGQLYVALSRVRHPDDYRIYSRKPIVNVVNPEIFFKDENTDDDE